MNTNSGNTKEIHGTFDGEYMIDGNGRFYLVPPNYASKSKILEGDKLKLFIEEDGNFIFKQVGAQPFIRLIGVIVSAQGGPGVLAGGRQYKALPSSITYFRLIPGNKVSIRIPDEFATWAVIENVIPEELQ